MNAIYFPLGNVGIPMAFEKDFKRRLSEALAKSGLKQFELAEKCGVGAPTVNKWLNQKNNILPAVDTLRRICDTLNCSAEYLVRGDQSVAPSSIQIAKARSLAGDIIEILGTSDSPEIKKN